MPIIVSVVCLYFLERVSCVLVLFLFFSFCFSWCACSLRMSLGFFYCLPLLSRESRLSAYLVLTVVVMFLEFGYGYISNSLGLMADSFHMLLDGCSILVGFLAAFYARKEPNACNPFGYVRYEVLCGFINGVLLLFVSFYIVAEASARMWFKADVEGDYLFSVSLIGLLLNIVGVACFHDSVFHLHGSQCDHNLRGIYLHILADLLGSICVLISSVAISYGYWFADPFFSLVSAILIFFSALPLVGETGKVLMLYGDKNIEIASQSVLQDIHQLQGINVIESPDIFIHSTPPNDFILCTVCAKVNKLADYSKLKHDLVEVAYRRLYDSFGSNCRVIAHFEY